MHAIITMTGKDRPGVIAAVAQSCAEHNLNIVDVSQTLMADFFTMIMRVELPTGDVDMAKLQAELDRVSEPLGMVTRIQSEALFDAMNDI